MTQIVADFDREFLSDESVNYLESTGILNRIDFAIRSGRMVPPPELRDQLRQYLRRKASRPDDPNGQPAGIATTEAVVRVGVIRLLGKLGNGDDAVFLKNLRDDYVRDGPGEFKHPFFLDICDTAIGSIRKREAEAHLATPKL